MKRSLLSLAIASFLILTISESTLFAGAGQSGARVPAGTEMQVRLNGKLDTGEAKAGETFAGTLAEPVVVNGRTVLARGAQVKGRVVEAVSSGRLKKPASITLELTSLSSQPLRIDGNSHMVRNAEFIGGGAAAGAIVGAITGGKRGAVIGTAVGAGAGTATAYMTGKKEIVIPEETLLTFVAAGSSTGSSVKTASNSGGELPSSSSSYRQGRRAQTSSPVDSEADVVPNGGSRLPVFTERDQRLIRSYFTDTSNLPPGLAKRGGNLPPGLEKQLRRNGTLPPGLQKRVQPFPQELNAKLPRLPADYSRVILAGKVMILDRNYKILDLFTLVR
jgi:Glycine zipper